MPDRTLTSCSEHATLQSSAQELRIWSGYDAQKPICECPKKEPRTPFQAIHAPLQSMPRRRYSRRMKKNVKTKSPFWEGFFFSPENIFFQGGLWFFKNADTDAATRNEKPLDKSVHNKSSAFCPWYVFVIGCAASVGFVMIDRLLRLHEFECKIWIRSWVCTLIESLKNPTPLWLALYWRVIMGASSYIQNTSITRILMQWTQPSRPQFTRRLAAHQSPWRQLRRLQRLDSELVVSHAKTLSGNRRNVIGTTFDANKCICLAPGVATQGSTLQIWVPLAEVFASGPGWML